MKRVPALRIDAGRALIACAIGIVAIGYVALARPFEARIAGRFAALEAARTTIDAQRSLAEQVRTALDERTRLRAAIAGFHLDASRAASVDRFLGLAFAAANRRGASIRALQTGSAATAPAPAGAPAFDELALQLTLRGSYAALVATVRDLAAAPLAARITIDALAPEDRSPATAPRLLASVGITLLRNPATVHVHAQPPQT